MSPGKHAKKHDYSPLLKLFLLWLVFLLALTAVLLLIFFRPEKPVKTIKVTIPRGVDTSEISEILRKKGVISNALTFRVYVSLRWASERLQPGSYSFKTSMTYAEILDKLAKGPEKKYFTITIPEGFTLKETVARLSRYTGRPAEKFLILMQGEKVSSFKFSFLPAGLTTLEGYIFPKTYTFEKKTRPETIARRMLYQFQIETEALDWSILAQKNLTKHGIITIASLIEEEAKVAEERPIIAAVIYNRLAKNMPLQIDATVQYALPERKAVLTYEDYKVDSPYNTYLRLGLPPGPITNPGLDSIKAALAPASVDYYYYVLTSPEGKHTFTRTYEEFLNAKKEANLN